MGTLQYLEVSTESAATPIRWGGSSQLASSYPTDFARAIEEANEFTTTNGEAREKAFARAGLR